VTEKRKGAQKATFLLPGRQTIQNFKKIKDSGW